MRELIFAFEGLVDEVITTDNSITQRAANGRALGVHIVGILRAGTAKDVQNKDGYTALQCESASGLGKQCRGTIVLDNFGSTRSEKIAMNTTQSLSVGCMRLDWEVLASMKDNAHSDSWAEEG